jgi:hypothetical protein
MPTIGPPSLRRRVIAFAVWTIVSLIVALFVTGGLLTVFGFLGFFATLLDALSTFGNWKMAMRAAASEHRIGHASMTALFMLLVFPMTMAGLRDPIYGRLVK